MRGFKQELGSDLDRAESRGRVRGELRVAGPRGKNHHPSLFQVPDRAPPDEGLRHFRHFHRGEDPRVDMDLLQGVLESQGVYNRGQHPHVVGDYTVKLKTLVTAATPDVSAAHDHSDLDVFLMGGFDVFCYLKEGFEINAPAGGACEGFTGELEYHSVRDWIHSSPILKRE